MKRKLYILLTFFSFCFFQSCQDHEIKKAPEAAELISKIAAADDQKLLQGLGLLQEKASKNGRISQTKIASLQLDSAIKRLNPDLGSTNYSFSIEENKPYSITNLVITENKGSYLAFFVEYISDNPKQGWNLANFSGKMKVTSVDGKREFERVVKPPQVKNGRTSSECEFNFAIVYVITPYGITQYTEWSFVCTLGGSGGFGWAVEGFGVGDGNNNGGYGNSGGEIDPGKIGIDDGGSPEAEFVVDQTIGRLCNNLTFSQVGRSFTAEISGLGVTAINHFSNSAIHAELGLTCVEIPDYYLRDRFQASEAFANAFNLARSEIPSLLNAGLLAPNSVDIRNKLKILIIEFLNSKYPGSTLSTGGCSGEVSKNTADYGC